MKGVIGWFVVTISFLLSLFPSKLGTKQAVVPRRCLLISVSYGRTTAMSGGATMYLLSCKIVCWALLPGVLLSASLNSRSQKGSLVSIVHSCVSFGISWWAPPSLQMGSWKGTTVQDSKRAAFVHAAGRAVTLPSCDHCDLCLLQNLFLLYCNYNKLPLNLIFFSFLLQD